MQALFCMDTLKNESDELLEGLSGMLELAPDINRFYMTLIKGVIDNKSQLDQLIEQFSSNWKIRRMGCVDRNILRIAAFEILYCHDIPPIVSINEAVDIGKLYGTEESGSFINGILDGIYQQQTAKNKKNGNSD